MPGAPEPFRIEVPEAVLADLRERLARTRWPDQIDSYGWRQGAELGTVRRYAAYWADDYDWRAAEARLNRFRQFTASVGAFASTSSTSDRRTRTRPRSSSSTAGRARSSSSTRSPRC